MPRRSGYSRTRRRGRGNRRRHYARRRAYARTRRRYYKRSRRPVRTPLDATKQRITLSGQIYDYGADQAGTQIQKYNNLSEADGSFTRTPYTISQSCLMNPFTIQTDGAPLAYSDGTAVDGTTGGYTIMTHGGADLDVLRYAEHLKDQFRQYRIVYSTTLVEVVFSSFEKTGTVESVVGIRPNQVQARKMYTPGSIYELESAGGYEMDNMTEWRRSQQRPKYTKKLTTIPYRHVKTRVNYSDAAGDDERDIVSPNKRRYFKFVWRNPTKLAAKAAMDGTTIQSTSRISDDGWLPIDFDINSSNTAWTSVPMKTIMLEDTHNTDYSTLNHPIITRVWWKCVVDFRHPQDDRGYA
jgi:hypothetical protein